MNVADKDLCEELFRLSGWVSDNWYEPPENNQEYLLTLEDVTTGFGGNYMPGAIPAYDLGYLLRKLPTSIALDDVFINAWLAMDVIGADGWQFSYRKGAAKPQIKAIADTPEDAAARLAIELLKSGILKGGDV